MCKAEEEQIVLKHFVPMSNGTILKVMKVSVQKFNEKKRSKSLRFKVPHGSALPVVLNVIGGHGWVGDSIVHDSVHRHRD
jgi:hypothetical protein